MLRTIKSSFSNVRFVPGFIGNNGTVTIPRYLGNLISATRTGTGVVSLVLKDKGAAALGCFATAVSDAHIANVTTGPSINGATVTTSTAGSPSDSNFHFVFVVADIRVPQYQDFARFPVSVAQAEPCLFAIKVNTTTEAFVDGNLTSRDASIQKNGTGDVTVTFSSGLSLPPVVIATSVGSNTKVSVASATNTAVRFKRTASGSGDDGVICAFVFGSYSKSQPGRSRRMLKGQRMAPRLLVASTDSTSVTFGAQGLGSTTVGSGEANLPFSRSFKVAPVAVLTADGVLTSSIHNLTTSGAVFRTHNNAGSVTAGKIFSLILGWDNESVFARF
jgi:hypothetical protein